MDAIWVISVQVGEPQQHGHPEARDPMQRAWESGIYKYPVQDAIYLNHDGLAGDGQADLDNHGGPEKAALCYAAAHYDYWQETLPDIEWTYGGFGENFTIMGQTEDDVAIGDVYRVGEAIVEVSQPRAPCWKLARRWNMPQLAAHVQEIGYTGWYVRVLEAGFVQAGVQVELLERNFPDWTVARASYVLNNVNDDIDSAAELAMVPPLAMSWKKTLNVRVARARSQ